MNQAARGLAPLDRPACVAPAAACRFDLGGRCCHACFDGRACPIAEWPPLPAAPSARS